jgi:hypothetical protein
VAYRELQKNRLETVRVAPARYQGYDLIDIRIYAMTKQGEVVPTKKGISLNVDQIPDLIESLEWALQQPCVEEPDEEPALAIKPEEADKLARFAHKVLSKHGLPIHWDIAESMILDNPEMRRFTKWQLHFVLTTRRDLFIKEGTGCFRANKSSGCDADIRNQPRH